MRGASHGWMKKAGGRGKRSAVLMQKFGGANEAWEVLVRSVECAKGR